ncbi:sister chromatid cohesion protein PDS5 homolog B-like isoform X2 [Macrosteles quadrilineatus]|uniref:sister chromatid cohesion protein PDS5 homolog B-like n=1 Tax=Macrosteles quadrilineatus TaxID=74068 RepID=UPI0023E28B5B|nr:sister chromatid cohesion protein PDS5 homolog B-like [Macrosteles quadrilineatus]XP_054274515.1 sister chromatid cohesion protein PDS5 homolog B-like isoform X2 [Macrosteles quadrilineatus]
MPHEIVYPQGCRPINEELGSDELIRRLKTLAHTLQAMGQDEGMYQQYIPLALHLAEEHFLMHQSKDVQLLIACCIADVLRVYAPEAPYKDPEQVKSIFMFLIKQLNGLRDPKDPAFKRYFYLLENLAYVKSFNMCFDLEDCQEIFCHLFALMLKIVNDEHSSKVKSFMLDVLVPLITESDIVSNELLDIILMNIVEPNKTSRKNAYHLAKELINKCSDTLEPYINAFFNQVLILGKEEKGLSICNKVYDLIYELNKICPSVLLAVLPQLECKLKSNQEQERLGAVALLARMFSEKESVLARNHHQLWRAFLGRFNDISVTIRIKCVQYSMHFLINHPELRKDIVETLKLRQHDSDENVRYEVVAAIVSTAKKDFEIVSQSEDLLDFVKERTLDKKFKIRKEAMTGLSLIYKKHLSDSDVPQATKKAVLWIKDKILKGYYMQGMEDRLLVERLLNTSLVPYTLPPEERMKKLYHLVGTIDDHATKAFVELQKSQLTVRKSVGEWLEIHRRPPSMEREKDIGARLIQISRFLPDPLKAQEFLVRFSKNMMKDPSLLLGMEALVRPDMSCKDCTHTTSLVLKKLGQPVQTNLYYTTVKMLLERISSVMVDSIAIRALIGFVEDCLKGGNLIEEIGLHPNNAGERGLRLLVMLSYIFPHHFLHEDIIQHLIRLLSMEEDYIAPLVLTVLTFLGKYKRLDDVVPNEINQLIPICKRFVETGTPKQAKHAIRCLFKNVSNNVEGLFSEMLEKVKENLTPTSPNYRTAIVALGHIAYNLPDHYPVHIKNLVSRKIVKELLVKESDGGGQNNDDDWCEEDQLPEETRCKIEGLKAMARWLLGLKNDKMSAQKTFRMLAAFMTNKGDLLQSGKLSKAEMSWLRLAAGCAMLKICEQKGVGDQFSPEQFYILSHLMIDEVPQVRETMMIKLHKGLGRGLPNKCLPLDFMGFYVLSGFEQDKRLRSAAKSFMFLDINKRREYAKTLTMGSSACSIDKAMSQLPHILPDYMLVFALPILVHCPLYTSHEDVEELTRLRTVLWFILEPLIQKNDSYCYGFYKELIDKMKNLNDAVKPEDNNVNCKLWALCDLSMDLLAQKTVNFEFKDFPAEARISPMYFKKNEDPNFVNTKVYIPPELMMSGNGRKGLTNASVHMSTTERPVRKTTRGRKPPPEPSDTNEHDVKPASASDSRIHLPHMEVDSDDQEEREPPPKRGRLAKLEKAE